MYVKLILFIIFVFTLSCKNIFDEVADKDSQEAIYYEAQLLLNSRNYDGAIALLQSLGPAFLARRDVQVIYASAYSGRCGLDLIGLASDLEDLASASNLFSFLFANYVGGTQAKMGDCLAAESILEDIGVYTARTPNENILMGLSSLVKIGTVLSARGDVDADAAVDPAFDHCDTTMFSDDDVAEIGTGIAHALLSASASGSEINPDLLTDITDICDIAPQLNVFCTTTDKTAYNALELAVLRAILGSTDQGIGACPGDYTACICP